MPQTIIIKKYIIGFCLFVQMIIMTIVYTIEWGKNYVLYCISNTNNNSSSETTAAF